MIYTVSIWLLPVLFAITFHEAAHGFVARFLGDETASRLGRVSLNPLRHIDPFGTIVLPGLLLLARSPFLFGYAKPVSVNFRAWVYINQKVKWWALKGSNLRPLPCEGNAFLSTACIAIGAGQGASVGPATWLGR